MARARKPWRGEDYADKGWTPETMRTCTKCDRVFPATRAFYGGNPLGKWGLKAECRGCFSKRRGSGRRAEAAMRMAALAGTGQFVCFTCDRVLPRSVNRPCGLNKFVCVVCAKAKAFRSSCLRRWPGTEVASVKDLSRLAWEYIDRGCVAYESKDVMHGLGFNHRTPGSQGGASTTANLFFGDIHAGVREGNLPLAEIVARYCRRLAELPGGVRLALKLLGAA